jgi:hypothetical protein
VAGNLSHWTDSANSWAFTGLLLLHRLLMLGQAAFSGSTPEHRRSI